MNMPWDEQKKTVEEVSARVHEYANEGERYQMQFPISCDGS